MHKKKQEISIRMAVASEKKNKKSKSIQKRKSNDSLEQGWANFSHEGPDFEKLLKQRAER